MQTHNPILVQETCFHTNGLGAGKETRTYMHFAGEGVKEPPPELCVEMVNVEEGKKLLTLIAQRTEEHARLHQEQK